MKCNINFAWIFATSAWSILNIYLLTLNSPPTSSTDNSAVVNYNISMESPKEIVSYSSGLAACLLMKDDNSKLGEWLAYHWMQGMQHLIVALDPTSVTSPKMILDAWQEITGMDIITWIDPDFRYVPVAADPVYRHDLRQIAFLTECFRHHKAKGRKWSFHIDTDEFIANNVAFGEGQSSIIRDDQTLWEYLVNKDATTPPSVDDLRNQVCVHLPRLTFMAVEELDQELLKNLAIGPFEPKNFATLRFSSHADPTDKTQNRYGKTLVNLEHVPFGLINREGLYSIHSPFKELCGRSYQYNERFPFMVHHYIGSWEQYSSREDTRRSVESFLSRAYHYFNRTHHIQGWFRNFVEKVGLVNSVRLLEGAGNIQQNNSSQTLLNEMPDYPTSRGGVQSYREGETEAGVAHYFEANGDRVEIDVKESCALLFFGLSRKFQEKAFASIKKLILDVNPSCDVFVHTYDVQNEEELTDSNANRTINAREVLLLTDFSKVMFETEDDFQRQRNVTFFHQFFPTNSAWDFPRSMDNMIRQWHSIAKVWELMETDETEMGERFDRVGFFRSDVIYTHPISISNVEEHAVIPGMMYLPTKWGGLNDRMFYGRREFAEVWATHRFDTLQEYIKWQNETFFYGDLRGLHSEDFMRYLLTVHGRLPLKIKNICFKRVRTSGDVLSTDCKYLKLDDLKSRSAPGVIILGMHRSGTSMLSGLLSNVFSWKVPGNPVTAKDMSQNRKGFFENVDVVRQDDEWLEQQNKTWDDVNMFTVTKEIEGSMQQVVIGRFDENLATSIGTHGWTALKEYKNPSNMPWVMKDPRMCLTLGAWKQTPLLKTALNLIEPPVLFTYRNPLEVALSLQARKRNSVPLLEGLRLWIWYNRESIRLSNNMCRVITSNEDIFRDPETELMAIQDRLSHCGLHPETFLLDKVHDFVDITIQHSLHDDQTAQDCYIGAFEDTNLTSTDHNLAQQEKMMYEMAMKVFCDLKSKKAFEDDYIWPHLPGGSVWKTRAKDSMKMNEIERINAQKKIKK